MARERGNCFENSGGNGRRVPLDLAGLLIFRGNRFADFEQPDEMAGTPMK